MTSFEDLSSCTLFAPPDAAGPILAVGWFERGHAYQRGSVQEEVMAALVQLLVDPWQPAVAGAGVVELPQGGAGAAAGPAGDGPAAGDMRDDRGGRPN